MNNLTKWIKKNWIRIAIISIVLFIAFPFLIDLVYKKGDITPLYKTKLSPSDILAYIGAFFSFAGTVALGFLALWQNQKIEENNDKFQEDLLKTQMNATRPMLYAQAIEDIILGEDLSKKGFLIGNFIYKIALETGIGFGFSSKINSITYNKKTTEQVFEQSNVLKGGSTKKTNDVFRPISKELQFKKSITISRPLKGIEINEIKNAKSIIINIDIKSSDVYENENIEHFYFGFDIKNKNKKLVYIDYIIKRDKFTRKIQQEVDN